MGFSDCQCIGLGEKVGHQLIMVGNNFFLVVDWRLGLHKSNKLNRNHSALVKKLEIGVLTIGSWLSKIDNCSLIIQRFSFQVDPLTVAFHIELLNVWNKLWERLAVGNNSSWGVFLDGSSVEANASKKQWDVLLNYRNFTWKLDDRKCSSIELPPLKNYFMASNPYCKLRGKTPIALQTENLPPTKSQNPNTFWGFTPNFPVSARLVEHAQTCLSTINYSSLTPSFPSY